MSRRLIHIERQASASAKASTRAAHIYRDTDWDEYQVELRVGGKLDSKATYYTGDWSDAQITAKAMVNPHTLTTKGA